MEHRALGKGLGSLIPQKQSLTEQVLPQARREVIDAPVGRIKENPRQPRRHFSPSDLEDLVNSVKEHGVMQPLIVTRLPGGDYELIAGERRLRASRTLGLPTVPVIVRDATEQEKLELALIENIQRQDLNAWEEALAYRALCDEFQLTQDEVGARVGKSRSAVANILRLLDLPEDMLVAMRDGRLSKSHARTLLAEVDPARRQKMFEAMLLGMTVREAEARIAVTSPRTRPPKAKDPNLVAHEKRLRDILGTKVSIQESAGKGKIAIEFYSREELLGLLDRLIG